MNASKRMLIAARGIFIAPILVTVALAILGSSSTSGYEYGITSTLCINIIALVGLNMIAGHAGQLALGHAGLIGAGAYTVVVAGTRHGMSGPLTLILAPLIAAALAVLIGIPTLRLRGLYFSVGTLAFAVIIDFIDNRATTLTGGPDGTIVNPLKFGIHSYSAPRDFFYLVLIFTIAILIFERLFVRSWVAWGLKAARASEPAAASAGVPIFSARLGTFALAGAIAGLAGALLAYQTQYVSPSSFTLQSSIDLFVVLFIGGVATFLGPVAGAFILYAFDRWLAPYPDIRPFALGAVFLLALRFFPGGLGGALNSVYAYLTHSRRAIQRGPHAPVLNDEEPEPVKAGVAP